MARPKTSEHRKDTRAGLLAAASELILQRGYDKTSIDLINERAGLSKGTFYHYFKSKSELLEAVVEKIALEGAANTRRAIEETRGDALDKFRAFLDAARRWRLVVRPQTARIMRTLFRPENALLRERMRDQSIELAAPALVKLLAKGNRDGLFRIQNPEATARIFLILAYGVSDDLIREVLSSTVPDQELLQRFTGRGQGFMLATEALLGLSPKALGGPDIELLSGMINTFRKENQP